jgi:hypothetical protein
MAFGPGGRRSIRLRRRRKGRTRRRDGRPFPKEMIETLEKEIADADTRRRSGDRFVTWTATRRCYP